MAVPPEFLVVMEGSRAEAEGYARRYCVGCPVIPDEEDAIRARLEIERTPYGLLVDSEGVIRMKGVVSDGWQLEGLIGRRGRRLGGLSWEEHPFEQQLLAETRGAGTA
jgi:hypothetical protein